jgi:glycosyltransferase involved in cell wall biosynthesis
LLVVLENKITKQFAEQYNKNILVITGPIDTERYFLSKKGIDNDKVVIGWIGSSSTTPYLSILFPVFRRLCRTYPNVYIKLIGAAPIDIPDVRVKRVDWDIETEVKELHEFDIGIMPLPDDEWTRGKGGYKLLQYMAVGIPFVASPVGINKDLIKDGVNGFLSATEEEWYEKLSLLIENPEIREKMGLRERDFVVKNYSFEVAAPKLIFALNYLL